MKLYSQTLPFRRHSVCVTWHHVTDAAELDDYGNPAETVADTAMRALVEPITGEEALQLEDRQTAHCRLYIDPCSDVTGHDRFTIRGELWHVVGPPAQWPNGTVVTVKKVV